MAIKNAYIELQMPKNCRNCRFCMVDNDKNMVDCVAGYVKINLKYGSLHFNTERPDNCPIKIKENCERCNEFRLWYKHKYYNYCPYCGNALPEITKADEHCIFDEAGYCPHKGDLCPAYINCPDKEA